MKGLDQQKTLVIMDIFTGKMKEALEENHILVNNVPPNMIRLCQPVDLMMNGSAKRFIAKNFNSWYLQQMSEV